MVWSWCLFILFVIFFPEQSGDVQLAHPLLAGVVILGGIGTTGYAAYEGHNAYEAYEEAEERARIAAAREAERAEAQARMDAAQSDLGQAEGNRRKVQRFLNVYIKEMSDISSRWHRQGGWQGMWENFGIVESESPGTIIDQISQRGVKEFMTLTPVQMSLLQPMFRIWVDASIISPANLAAPSPGQGYTLGQAWQTMKSWAGGAANDLLDGNYVQLKFPDRLAPSDIEAILDGEQTRPSGVWFISFDWKDIGNTPTMENTMFDCTLKFGCESLAALDAPQDPTNPRTNFKELLRPVNPGTAVGCRIQVGWSPPIETDIIDGDLSDAIQNMQKIFDCNMTGYNIDFKENGTIEVEVKYIAGIDKANAEPGNDLLTRVSQTYEDRQEDHDKTREDAGLTMGSGEGGTEEVITILRALASTAGSDGLRGAEQSGATRANVARLQEISGYFQPHLAGGDSSAIAGLSSDSINAIMGSETTNDDGTYPAPGLNETYDGDPRALAGFVLQRAGDLFTLDGQLKGGTTAADLESIVRSVEAVQHFQGQTFRSGYRNRMAAAYSAIINYLHENGKIYMADLDIDHLVELNQGTLSDPDYIDSIEVSKVTGLGTHSEAMFDGALEAIGDTIEVNEESRRGDTYGAAWDANLTQYAKVNAEDRTVRAMWFYMGDVLDYAFDRRFWARDAQHFHALIGPLTLAVHKAGESPVPVAINLADIPVNLPSFMVFMQRQMERRGGGNARGQSVVQGPLTVKTFVQDLFHDVIVKRLGAAADGASGIRASADHSSDGILQVDVMTFMTVPFDDGTYLFDEGVRTNLSPTTDIPMIFSHHVQDVQSYYYMFAASNRAENCTGDEDADQLVPIYHLRYGRENGIVKNIKFTREDTKYFQEGVIQAAFGDNTADSSITTQIRAGSAPSLLKYVYRLEATLFGNVLFHPGCKIYLKPEYPGTPMDSGIIADLGLGGYYFITSCESFLEAGKFETKIKGYLELVYTGTAHGSGQFNSVVDAFGAGTFEGGATGVAGE